MNRVLATTWQEGIRRDVDPSRLGELGTLSDRSRAEADEQASKRYRLLSRREGERLLAWYRRSMTNRTHDEQEEVLALAVRNINYLLPTLRRVIMVAEEELASLGPLYTRRSSLQQYLNGVRSLWEILIARVHIR